MDDILVVAPYIDGRQDVQIMNIWVPLKRYRCQLLSY